MNNLEYVIQINPNFLKEMEEKISKYGSIKKITNIKNKFSSFLISLNSIEHINTIQNMDYVLSISLNSTFHHCLDS